MMFFGYTISIICGWGLMEAKKINRKPQGARSKALPEKRVFWLTTKTTVITALAIILVITIWQAVDIYSGITNGTDVAKQKLEKQIEALQNELKESKNETPDQSDALNINP